MENKALDILKSAILFEQRGKAFYSTVAQQTSNMEVRKIFETMAHEEQTHIEFLSEQFRHYQQNNEFKKVKLSEKTEGESIADLVLTEQLKNELSSAGYEAAAISAAIDMETKAIELYSSRAKEASDLNEKIIYEWLADWEQGHHKILNELNKELMEKIWYDNQYWPF